MTDASQWIGLAGVVLGVLLGFGGQLILARRQEARRLDEARRELYAEFLTAVKFSLEHLAEGATRRLNAEAVRGAYSETYVKDQAELQTAISGMELVSTRAVLDHARELREAHWKAAEREGNADAVPATADDETRRALAEEVSANLKRLTGMKDAFVVAAQRELHLAPLLYSDRR